MPITTGPQISLNEIHAEVGGTSGSTATINDSDIRALIGKGNEANMQFSEWYGASAVTNGTTTTGLTLHSSAPTFSSSRLVFNGIGKWGSNNSASSAPSGFTQTYQAHYDVAAQKYSDIYLAYGTAALRVPDGTTPIPISWAFLSFFCRHLK